MRNGGKGRGRPPARGANPPRDRDLRIELPPGVGRAQELVERRLDAGVAAGAREVEIALVIGRTAHYVEEDRALDHVAGYFVCNDVSEREFQLEQGGQWVKGKMAPSFGPLGPWLVTSDEIADVQKLKQVRPYVIVGAFIVAAIFTPPDVVSQLLLAIPLVVLYELGIVLARFFGKPKPEEDASPQQAS